MARVQGRRLPLSQLQRVKEARSRKLGVVIAPGVEAPTPIERWYRAQLQAHVNAMRDDIEKELFPMLLQDNYVLQTADSKVARLLFKNRDGFMDNLARMIDRMRKRWDVADARARELAGQFVGKIDKDTQAKIEKIVGNAMGVDLVKVLRNEGLTSVVEAGIVANVQLIKSIPREYLDKVQMIITQEGTKGQSSKSLIKQIQEVYPVTTRKARTIARDQTAKLNGDISRQRQVAAGIRGYRWRTVGDNAVRESHKERNGKFFAWSPSDVGKKLENGEIMRDPEADDIGHPGEDYNCRCYAEPVIELDTILQ